MRLRLSDGTFIDASMLNGTSRSSSRSRENAPSKRQVKQGGGSLKRLHSRTSGSNVGGTKNGTRATYINFEVDPDDPAVIVINRSQPRETCIVVPASRIQKSFTWELGGSTPSPYRGGKGL